MYIFSVCYKKLTEIEPYTTKVVHIMNYSDHPHMSVVTHLLVQTTEYENLANRRMAASRDMPCDNPMVT